MVRQELRLKATLDNCAHVVAQPDMDWYFQVKCTSCHEVHEKEVTVNMEEMVEIPDSRGTAHLYMKCKFCQKHMNLRESTIYTCEMLAVYKGRKWLSKNYRSCHLSRYGSIKVDTKGKSFKNGEAVYENVALNEDFCEYDDEGGCVVAVMDPTTSVERNEHGSL